MLFLFSLSTVIILSESCKKEESCPTINCNTGTLNEETCACDCPVGFSGTNCTAEDLCVTQNVVCENGGTCVDGICDCPDGFSGTNCETEDLCITQNVVCENGGTCVEGTCECPEGYYGSSCESQTVQHRLLTETPFDLINNNVPLDSLYGKIYEGGLIVYLNTTVNAGMVAATEDQSEGAEWGCWDTDIISLNNVFNSQETGPETEEGARIGDGKANTDAILAAMCMNSSGIDEIAAKLCRDLGDEWFLPSRGELTLIYTNLHLKGHGNFEFGSYYSSSTEFDSNKAWVEVLSSGDQALISKLNSVINVRAVRAF